MGSNKTDGKPQILDLGGSREEEKQIDSTSKSKQS